MDPATGVAMALPETTIHAHSAAAVHRQGAEPSQAHKERRNKRARFHLGVNNEKRTLAEGSARLDLSNHHRKREQRRLKRGLLHLNTPQTTSGGGGCCRGNGGSLGL